MKMHRQVFLLCCFICTIFTENPTLRYVQVLFRHGERTPKGTYPNDPHQADTWPEGWEQVTKKGMEQLFNLGKYVRHRYIDTGFLKPHYTENDVYVLSTYFDRTVMSAKAMLAGLYPPSGQSVPVHSIPKKGDYLLRMECKTYVKLRKRLFKSSYVRKLEKEYQDVMDIVKKYSGFRKPTFDDLLNLGDPLRVELSHNLTLPTWLLQNDIYKRIIDMKDIRAQLKFYTLDMAVIKGGPLVGRMIANMKKVQKSGKVKKKMEFYSGHKTNVNAVLSTLRMFNGRHIPLTSAVFVELHESPSNEWTVQWLYMNDTSRTPYLLTVPGCTSSCELSKLKLVTADVIPEDPKANCTGKHRGGAAKKRLFSHKVLKAPK